MNPWPLKNVSPPGNSSSSASAQAFATASWRPCGGHPGTPAGIPRRVGLNTASAEGWGMVSFEHAATGAPQIVPGHWVCREIWEGHAEVLDLAAPPCRVDSPILKEGIVSAEGVAAALKRLYCDRNYRAHMSERALANATRAEYQWRHIAKAWGALLDGFRAPPALNRLALPCLIK